MPNPPVITTTSISIPGVVPSQQYWPPDTNAASIAQGASETAAQAAAAAAAAATMATAAALLARNLSPNLIFRPGGVANEAENIFTNEADLAAASQEHNGAPYVIFWDLSLAPTPGFYTFTTVGTLNLAAGGQWTDISNTAGNGSPAQFSTQLTFANGTVMPNPPSDVFGFIQIEVNQPYPNIPWTSTTHSGKTTFHDFTGAWSNAGMAPLINSTNYWLVVMEDAAMFNYGPVNSGPLLPSQVDFLLQVNLYAGSEFCYVGPNTINFIFGAGGNPYIDPTNYPYLALGGLFNDPTGTGNTIIPAQFAGTLESGLGLLFCQGPLPTSPAILYYSNGTVWVPVIGSAQEADYALFFALMPGDNTATIAVGAPVLFPQTGATSSPSSITRNSPSTFQLATAGNYEVTWQVSISEAGQLQLALNGVGLPATVVGRAGPTTQIYGSTIITTTLPNSLLSVINPVGNSTALTVTPIAGGTNAVSATLSIKAL